MRFRHDKKTRTVMRQIIPCMRLPVSFMFVSLRCVKYANSVMLKSWMDWKLLAFMPCLDVADREVPAIQRSLHINMQSGIGMNMQDARIIYCVCLELIYRLFYLL